jgi:serine/threonine protein kinase
MFCADRDLKPGNLLVSKDCRLKITDFGLARHMDQKTLQGLNTANPPTEVVVTQAYRCPELLIFPENLYTAAVDLWSVGCIIGELHNHCAMFHLPRRLQQVKLIFSVLGFSGVGDLGMDAHDIPHEIVGKLNELKCEGTGLEAYVPKASLSAMRLMSALLSLNPAARPTAEEALTFDFAKIHVKSLDGDDSTDSSKECNSSPASATPNTSPSPSGIRPAGSKQWTTCDPWFLSESAMDSYFAFENVAMTTHDLVLQIIEEVKCGSKRADVASHDRIAAAAAHQQHLAQLVPKLPDIPQAIARADAKGAANPIEPSPRDITSTSTGDEEARPECESSNHWQRTVPTRLRKAFISKGLCYRCGEAGHKAVQCGKRRNVHVGPTQQPPVPSCVPTASRYRVFQVQQHAEPGCLPQWSNQSEPQQHGDLRSKNYFDVLRSNCDDEDVPTNLCNSKISGSVPLLPGATPSTTDSVDVRGRDHAQVIA